MTKSILRMTMNFGYTSIKRKPVVMTMGCVLARHCGLTAEELDFIINYDVKYRMGASAEEGEDSEQ